jgi:hypothetical protein
MKKIIFMMCKHENWVGDDSPRFMIFMTMSVVKTEKQLCGRAGSQPPIPSSSTQISILG